MKQTIIRCNVANGPVNSSWRKYQNGICRTEVQTDDELVRRWTQAIGKCEWEILLIDADLFRLFLTLKQVHVQFSIPHLFHLEPSLERRRLQGKQMTEVIIHKSFGNLLGSITTGFPNWLWKFTWKYHSWFPQLAFPVIVAFSATIKTEKKTKHLLNQIPLGGRCW